METTVKEEPTDFEDLIPLAGVKTELADEVDAPGPVPDDLTEDPIDFDRYVKHEDLDIKSEDSDDDTSCSADQDDEQGTSSKLSSVPAAQTNNHKEKLQRLIDVLRSNIKEHNCEFCDFNTNREASSTCHENSAHSIKHKYTLHESITTRHNFNLRARKHIDNIHHKTNNYCAIKEDLHCQFCDFVTNAENSLKRHVESAHLKAKIFKCDFCNYSTCRGSILKRHIDGVHLKLKNHKCKLCDFGTHLGSILKRHIDRSHFNVKNHKCSICDYSTVEKALLNRHVDSIHNRKKDRKCEFCDYCTSETSALKQHIRRLHSKVRNHKCKFCDYCALFASEVEKHTRSVHKDNLKIND